MEELFALSIEGYFSSVSQFCKHLPFIIWALIQRGQATLLLRTGTRQKPSLSTWLYIVTIINCLLLLHSDTECGSCAKHNEAQFPTS